LKYAKKIDKNEKYCLPNVNSDPILSQMWIVSQRNDHIMAAVLQAMH